MGEGSEGEKSGPIENSTESWDLSASVEARGLGETPAQDAVTQVSELPQATEAHDEHASEDTLGLHENVTLDVMATAALSASSQDCVGTKDCIMNHCDKQCAGSVVAQRCNVCVRSHCGKLGNCR